MRSTGVYNPIVGQFPYSMNKKNYILKTSLLAYNTYNFPLWH